MIIDTLLPLSSCLILNYFIISLRYSFIHSSLNYSSYFFLSIKLLFLMSSEICKEYREYLYLSYALRGKCPLFERIHCVKSARVRNYSGRHFPAFGLNTERYFVSLRIKSEYGKMRTRITPNTGTFHAVYSFKQCHQQFCAIVEATRFGFPRC